jgi:peptidoglycan-associated lipoprotein
VALCKVRSRLMERSFNEHAGKPDAKPDQCVRNGGPEMVNLRQIARGARIAALLVAALAVSACANKAAEEAQANAGGMATPGSQQDFVVNVGDRVFFDTDSSDLTAQSRATLDKQAQWLNTYSQYGQFTVEGHADERGTREYNIALGARRAQTVRNYLVSHGIAANRIRTISYGKERPVAVCDDISCWSQNRRAVTVLGVSS